MPLLRWLSNQHGQGTANMGIVAATIACLIWSMLLLTGVDLRPGLQTLAHAVEPLKQQIQQLIEG
jgi:hypothetical protein